jgi:hypothetical protein
VIGPAPDGGPAPARVLKTNASVIALPVITLLPAVALLITGTVTHSLALRWLAPPSAWPGAPCSAGVRSSWRSSGWRTTARRSSPGSAPRRARSARARVACGQPSAINRLLILNAEPHPGRGTVLLLREPIGF